MQQYFNVLEQAYTTDSVTRRQLLTVLNKDLTSKGLPKITSLVVMEHFYPILWKYLQSMSFNLRPRVNASTLLKSYSFVSPTISYSFCSSLFTAFKNQVYNIGQKFTKMNSEITFIITSLSTPTHLYDTVAIGEIHIPSLGIVIPNQSVSAYSLEGFKEG